MSSLDRRRFLQAPAALGGTLVSSGIGRAAPARIDAPVVDRVVIREIIDNSHDVSLGPRAVRGSNCHRGPCLHDRRGAAHRHRVRAPQYLDRGRDQGRAGLRRERLYQPSFHCHELAGKPQPDQHWHEHATCFRLGDRGLVVIGSCGHPGIINTLKRAQEVSGVEKIYALVGGFHLFPTPDDYLRQVMAELKKFDPST